MFKYISILFIVALCSSSCKKEYRCNCMQDVAGIDTSFTLTGEGHSAHEACDAFDSEETEFGITKTVDCEPF